MAYSPTQPAVVTNGRQQNVERVKQALDNYLRYNPEFHAWPDDRKVSFYRHALESGVQALEGGLVRQLANDMQPTRIRDVGELAGGFLEEVDFPDFVRDLINGVYGSIVESTIQQMDAYVKMYQGLAKPLASIAREISDADALGQVASSDPTKYRMEGPLTLVENDTGTRIELGSEQEGGVPEEIQRLMYQAKLDLARERRLILRETMLMGVQRLVVDEGEIRAGLVFNVRATEKSEQRQKTTEIEETGGQLGGSFFGFFGGGRSNKETRISVSTRALQTDMQLAAQITGHVSVKFSTDRFDLNNFAQLFGTDQTRQELQQRQGQLAPAPPGAAPAGAVPVATPAPAPVPVR